MSSGLFSVVLDSDQAPTMEQIAGAFVAARAFARADALAYVSTPTGVLGERLEQERAVALQAALRERGVATAVLDEGEFPPLPRASSPNRIECDTDAFVVHDLHGRPHATPWSDVAAVSAGDVGFTKFDTRRSVKIAGAGESAVAYTDVDVTESKRTSATVGLLLRGPARVQWIEAERLARLPGTGGREARFVALVRRIVSAATSAALGFGARSIADGAGTLAVYPSRLQFERELRWLAWRQGLRFGG